MTPALKLAFSLVLSLLMWLPTVPGALANSDDPYRIALRYLVALLVARVAVGLFFRVVGGYVVEEELESEPTAEVPEERPGHDAFGRRRDDVDMPLPREEDLLDEALEEAADSAALVQH